MHNLVLAIGFGLVTASVISLAAVAVTLQFGITNYINFATGSYIALGAFLTWEFNVALGLNWWLAMPLSGLAVGLVAVLISETILEPFARRRSPIVLLVVTFGVWYVATNVILAIWGSTPRGFNIGGTTPIPSGPFSLTPDEYVTMAIAVAAMIGVHLMLTRTHLGKAMRAMSDDRDLAVVSGIDARRLVQVAWMLSGTLVGISGSLIALDLSKFAAGFGDSILFVVFAAVVVGGIGQPYGAMIGALIIGLVTEVGAVIINPVYKYDLAFGVLVLAVLVRPQGLLPARGRN
jgi:branched-chain amino acid transport system permease protein/neutral amino acid transport system permease protein